MTQQNSQLIKKYKMMEEQEDYNTYFLRSKKRKLDYADGEEVTPSYSNKICFRSKTSISITSMPLEVRLNVLKYISYEELSDNVRKVNRNFKLDAEDLLNRAFKSLIKKFRNLTSTTFQAIGCTDDDMELKCLCRLVNLLELICFQQTVIMATIWRYVYNEYYRTQKSCMYGGRILDLYETLIRKVTINPQEIYGPAVADDYALPDDVKDLIHLTQIFCIHFDKVIEEPIEHALNISGCKIIDLLDCAIYVSKSIVLERIIGNTFSAKYCYSVQNAWFARFGMSPEKRMSLKQKQRMMYMRIRRIVLGHTEMFMQEHQYEREMMVRSNPIIEKPSASVARHDESSFCYGVMNSSACIQEFHLNEERDDVDDVLGLDINIQIDCPLAYAPHKYVQENEDLIREEEESSHGAFNLCIEFNFPGVHYPRSLQFNVPGFPGAPYPMFPTTYTYQERISTRQF